MYGVKLPKHNRLNNHMLYAPLATITIDIIIVYIGITLIVPDNIKASPIKPEVKGTAELAKINRKKKVENKGIVIDSPL